jgi:phospholipase C
VPPLRSLDTPTQREPAEMLTSGYLERLGFKYKPATPATMYSHPTKLGMRP